MNTRKKRSPYFWLILAALTPFVVAGVYVTLMNVIHMYRYDERFFTDEYREKYPSPGPVAIAIESAIQSGKADVMQELSGLRRDVKEIEPNPEVMLTILYDVDDFGYFHYLYLDMGTFRRATYYIKEVSGRYVYVPEDFYFYYDSGYWWDVYLPIAITWWVITIAVLFGVYVYQVGARTRQQMTDGRL